MPANKTILVVGACALLLAVGACRSAPTTAASVPLETQAALTVQALLTQVSAQASDTPTLALPSETPLVPPTFAPTLTIAPLVLSTETPVPYPSLVTPVVQGTPTLLNTCYAAFFVGDVIYPDGTVVQPTRKFTKTWDVRNVGTCTWTPAYRLVFYNGKHMDGPNYVYFGQSVPPGGHIFLSVDLLTPAAPGPWEGEWVLEAPDGTMFGVSGVNGVFPLRVYIIVIGTLTPTPTP